jgi:hypothetical protein
MIDITSDVYTKNNILSELIRNQRKNVDYDNKLYLSDMQRIVKFIPCSIFLENVCCCWEGYITNKNKPNKATYINFYFKHKKKALHRLLYINYIDSLNDDEYIKFKCDNKGFCCSLSCMYKVNYKKITKKKEEYLAPVSFENIKKERGYSFDNVSFDIVFI